MVNLGGGCLGIGSLHLLSLFKKKFYYIFIWPCQVLVVACGIFNCSVWDLVP